MTREGKAPSFQFYASDWLADENVVALGLAGRGLYITLLCYAWREGSIPDDPERLVVMASCSRQEFDATWPAVRRLFSRVPRRKPCRLVHRKLEEQRRSRMQFLEGQRKFAVDRERNKRENKAVTVPASCQLATSELPASHQSASASASASAPEVVVQTPEVLTPLPAGAAGARVHRARLRSREGDPEGFAEFYARYPRKVDRKEALRAWNALGPPDPELRAKIMAGLEAWEKSREWQEGAILYPERFLKRRRWEAQVTAEAQDWKAAFLKGGNGDGELHRSPEASEVAAEEAGDS